MEALVFSDPRANLRDAADALVNESIEGVTTSELGTDIIEIRLTIDRLEAECLRRLERFHADRGAQSDGGGTTVSWLRRSCGMTAKAAAYRVFLARTLAEMPAMLDSARAGRASFTNVAMVAHLACAPPPKPFDSASIPTACSPMRITLTSDGGWTAIGRMAECSFSAGSSMPKAVLCSSPQSMRSVMG